MTITANTMIKRAMRIMRVLPVYRDPTADEAADGLYALNSMMEAWSIERLMVYQIQQVSNAWTTNSASMTIGSGGDINIARPTKIEEEGNFFRDGSTLIDYPLLWLGDKSSYDRILLKSSTSSYPQWIYYSPGYPLGTVFVWPVPTMALTLYLQTWKPLQTFTGLTDAISLPPGYQAAIEFNLAAWWKGEFGSAAQMDPDDIARAKVLKHNLKAVNAPDLVAQVDGGLLPNGVPYNIYVDGPAMGRP